MFSNSFRFQPILFGRTFRATPLFPKFVCKCSRLAVYLLAMNVLGPNVSLTRVFKRLARMLMSGQMILLAMLFRGSAVGMGSQVMKLGRLLVILIVILRHCTDSQSARILLGARSDMCEVLFRRPSSLFTGY